ncbi:uridine nucleosidase [Trichomonascus vanleenenianus]|uniref:trifunctional uridine nucleosidase/nicotinamide riboside hydrolase/nicotinic acid riboside hydrolase n=1 Tax=Trichomonascus vanleenenianus TaxID=2268995 RepID=UPI003ECAB8E8
MQIPVWLDCDPGHDDAFAMLVALFHPSFRLLGISTVHGNASLDNTTTNAISLLTAYECLDIHVYPGSEKPLERPVRVAVDIHGVSGLDGTALLPAPAFEAQPDHSAVPAMAQAIEEYSNANNGGQVALVATGALTNIALLIQNFPQVIPKIKVLSIMGGAVPDEPGNWTDHAEFNIWVDPLAAQVVLGHPQLAPKTVVVPLKLTHTLIATEDVQSRIQHPPPRSPVRQMLYELMTFFADTYKKVFNFVDGPPLHDPAAVLAVLPFYGDNSLGFEFTRHNLSIVQSGECEGKFNYLDDGTENERGVYVAEKVDVEAFWNVIIAAIDTLDGHIINK